jgi:predicted glycoside hydrolase/deacetylase ChbG (UPF0249 family)
MLARCKGTYVVVDSNKTVPLVLHADDFGMSPAVSDGILRAFNHGLLTSTSILANAPDFRRALDHWAVLLAAKQAGDLPSRTARVALNDSLHPFDLGVHLNLTQGQPLTGRHYPGQLLDGHGQFYGVGRTFLALLAAGRAFRQAVRNEITAQVERTIAAGVDVLHLNGHQYVELIPLVGELILDVASEFGIRRLRLAREPGLRQSLSASRAGPISTLLALVKHGFSRRLEHKLAASQLDSPFAFFGTAHAGIINLAVCHAFLSTIKKAQRHGHGTRPMICEIAFHPGLPPHDTALSSNVAGWCDPLSTFRPQECEFLTSDSLVQLLSSHNVRLSRIREIPGGW